MSELRKTKGARGNAPRHQAARVEATNSGQYNRKIKLFHHFNKGKGAIAPTALLLLTPLQESVEKFSDTFQTFSHLTFLIRVRHHNHEQIIIFLQKN